MRSLENVVLLHDGNQESTLSRDKFEINQNQLVVVSQQKFVVVVADNDDYYA